MKQALKNILETASETSEKQKFIFDDWGWVVLSVGMGIGAGIAFAPIPVSMCGLWIFLTVALIGYPGIFFFQLMFTAICSPIFGIVGCLIPALLVFKTPGLKKRIGAKVYFVIFVGILLCLAPFADYLVRSQIDSKPENKKKIHINKNDRRIGG